MKFTAFTAAILLASTSAHAYSARSLSIDPIAYNEDGVCVIRGAVWSRHDGALAGAKLAIVEVGGPVRAEVITDEFGYYEARIASAPGTVFRERIDPELRQSFVRVGSRLPAVREPTFACHKGLVSIGEPSFVPEG